MMTIRKHGPTMLLTLGVLTAGLATGGLATGAQAEPGGCLKYGAVGAVGGHLANHGVLGAVGGCAAGMYTRHEYRKMLRQKAALYDQEHPVDPHLSAFERYRQRKTDEQKATLWDAEHPQQPAPPAAH